MTNSENMDTLDKRRWKIERAFPLGISYRYRCRLYDDCYQTVMKSALNYIFRR